MIARRPGKFALVIDLKDGGIVRRIDAADGRRFCGHGQFTPDGDLLMTENDYDAGHGVIGIYDYGKNYARRGEIATGGTGPHEMLLSGDGRTAIVANGGIETHPDYGRLKLNLATMQPNVALVDIADVRPTRTFRAPEALHQLSLSAPLAGIPPPASCGLFATPTFSCALRQRLARCLSADCRAVMGDLAQPRSGRR